MGRCGQDEVGRSSTPDATAVASFIRQARERLAWMDGELARLENESDRRALAGARAELARSLETAGNGGGMGRERRKWLAAPSA